MVDLIEEAYALQSFLQTQQWRFCFIGGLASQVWGELRLTRDVALSLLTGFGNEAEFGLRLRLTVSRQQPLSHQPYSRLPRV